jgi:HK97 family phage major capsid protein
MHEIVKGLESYGNLYAAVRHLNVQGGVEIPVLSLKPTATWITANTNTAESEDQKLLANTSIMFSYFGLECKIAQTLLANVTTIEAFQALFVPLATEAMAKALDAAIIKGTGSGMPLGVTADSRVPSKNVITLTAEEFTSYSAWKKKVFGKMKKSYRNGTFYMAQGTFDGYIDGMTDSVGQPVGRVNYGIDGAENYRFCGKNVETVEDDVITSYDDASTGDVVAVFFKASDYGVNSNMEMKTVKWTDNETNEVKMKTILICDGKLIDANGVIIVKKGA